MTDATMLEIALLRRDGGTQPRDHVSIEIARDYAEAMEDGAVLPPVTVFYDGSSYWLADGFHRAMAHELRADAHKLLPDALAMRQIACDVRQGTLREAVLYSVGANASHGYRRSNLDKRRAVATLLNDPEWSKMSDRAIAKHCAVGPTLVNTLRPQVVLPAEGSDELRTCIDRHGKHFTMRVAAIGKTKPSLPLVAGRAPDRRPNLAAAGQSEFCGLAVAGRITGLSERRLSAIARTGEIEGAEKASGSWIFETRNLKAWMKSAPDGPTADEHRPRDAAPPEAEPDPVVDFEEGRRLLEITDAISLLATLGPAADTLQIWSRFRGNPIPQETITAASAWMADFSARYPDVERTRQMAVADMLERIEANVA